MRRLLSWTAWGLLLVAGPLALGAAQAEPKLKVFAAASLSESLQDIAKLYKVQGGVEAAFNFAASGTLVRQIQEGAPADLIFSADGPQVDRLDKAGLLKPGSRVNLLSNTLAVVLPADSPLTITSAADLTGPRVVKLAIGDPATVPVGTYTKTWLQGAKLWDKAIDKAVPCDSVRGVLAAVESGNVEAGVVYRTDALISKKLRVAFVVPREAGPPIVYPVAQLKDAPSGQEADRFLVFVRGPAAAAVFKARGFILLSPTASAP